MAARTAFNIVTFTPVNEDLSPVESDSRPIYAAMKMQGPIRFSVGLKPNVWLGIMPPAEFEKIKDHTAKRGVISLWYDSDPNDGEIRSPNVTINDVILLDVEAASFGQRVKLFNEDEWGITEYRVTFADYRQNFVEPRGGRLREGLVNPKPDPVNDVEPPEEVTMSEAIIACLLAMGVNIYIVPASVDDLPLPHDIKWFGNHAPTELQKLLDACQCVYVPGRNGIGLIDKIGEGAVPNFPTAESLPNSLSPAVDCRGKKVIFSTFPNRVCSTRVISGPSDETWQFVIQDSTGAWVNQEEADILGPYISAEAAMQDECNQLDTKWKERARSQLYRFLRLNEDTDQFPDVVLTHAMDTDGGRTPIEVLAKMAVYKDSIWSNTDDPVSVPVSFVKGRIVQLPYPLGRVNPDPTINWPRDFVELADGDLSVRVTMEQSERDAGGKVRPKYFHCGWEKTTAGVARLSEEDVENAIDGNDPDAFFILRDDLRALFDEEGDNVDGLVKQLEPLAQYYLSASDARQTIKQARGFQPCELSGKVNEITWDQEKLVTTVVVGTWFAPSGAIPGSSLIRTAEAAGAEDYPGQNKTESDDLAMGTGNVARATRPVTPLGYVPPPSGLARTAKVYTAADRCDAEVVCIDQAYWDSDPDSAPKITVTLSFDHLSVPGGATLPVGTIIHYVPTGPQTGYILGWPKPGITVGTVCGADDPELNQATRLLFSATDFSLEPRPVTGGDDPDCGDAAESYLLASAGIEVGDQIGVKGLKLSGDAPEDIDERTALPLVWTQSGTTEASAGDCDANISKAILSGTVYALEGIGLGIAACDEIDPSTQRVRSILLADDDFGLSMTDGVAKIEWLGFGVKGDDGEGPCDVKQIKFENKDSDPEGETTSYGIYWTRSDGDDPDCFPCGGSQAVIKGAIKLPAGTDDNFTIITDVFWDGSSLKKKTRTVEITDGRITDLGTETTSTIDTAVDCD